MSSRSRAAGRRARLLTMVGGAWLWTAGAFAQAPEAVALEVPDCLGVRGDDVRALIALELAPRLRVAAPDEPAPALTATARCDAGAAAFVIITVEDAARAAPLRVELDLARAAPNARTRLLALSIAELIATSRLETPPPVPAAAAEATETTETTPDARAPSPFRVFVGPGFSLAASPATVLFGASAGVSRAFGALAFGADLQARFGGAELTDAEVAVQAFSGSLTLMPLLTRGAIELGAGAGVRAGYARLAAESLRPELVASAFHGAWFGPIAVAVLDLDVARPGSVHLALEAGYATHGLVGQDAEERTLISLRGPFMSLTAGVALAL